MSTSNSDSDSPGGAARSPAAIRRLAEQYLSDGRLSEGLELLNAVLDTDEVTVADWLLAGTTLLSVGESAQAVAALSEGLKRAPNSQECRYQLATAEFQLGDVPAAASQFQAVAESCGNLKAWQSLATIIPGCAGSGHDRVREVRCTFARLLRESSPIATTEDLRRRDPGSRLRVGYLSAFFHRANYMKPVWGLINGHDRGRFEISLFADDTDAAGLEWFQPGPHDHVHLTTELDNQQLVRLIREQQLDIVVDLNGYSVPARLEVLVHRLATVGVAWFNMYATSGLPGLDWIVGDDCVVRPEEEVYYTERVHRLSQSCLSFAVGHSAPDVAPPPCLKSSALTFGSLVSQYKITPGVLDAWSEMLRRTPGTQLVLANRALRRSCNRDYVLEQFRRRDIAGDRIRLLPPAPHFEYLKYYDQIDLALDSFPYNGGTTTTEAIWQGVPVLTFDGDRWASRTSHTLLVSAQLAEFSAPSERAYVELAVQWATDAEGPRKLAELRPMMRANLLRSPVCRIGGLVADMERFYLDVLRQS